MKAHNIVLLSITAIICVLIIYAYQKAPKKTVTVREPPEAHIRADKFYAASRYFKDNGIIVFRFSEATKEQLGQIPVSDTILIDGSRNVAIHKDEAERLYEWYDRGGHIVITPPEFTLPQDTLLTVFKLKTEKKKKIVKPVRYGFSSYPCRCQGVITNYRYTSIPYYIDGTALHGRTEKGYYIPGKPDGRKSPGGYLHTQRDNRSSKTNSRIFTYLSDLKPFYNQNIAAADHMKLLWHLTLHRPAGEQQKRNLWILTGRRQPSLAEIFTERALWITVFAVLLFVIYFWSHFQRFGPVLPDTSMARRSLIEHLRADGRYFLRSNNYWRLYNSVLEMLYFNLERRIPPAYAHSSQGQISYLSRISNIEPQKINSVLTAGAHGNREKFFDYICILRKLILDLESRKFTPHRRTS